MASEKCSDGVLKNTITWRFRLVRDDWSSAFVRRAHGQPFEGDAEGALAFAEKVRQYKAARRVEAWTEALIELPPAIQVQFRVERHKNGRDWEVLESRLAHGLWTRTLFDAIDHLALRAVGLRYAIRVAGKTTILADAGPVPFAGFAPRLESTEKL